ncbi:MAG: efflux RND transporter periplasmic adaptor subunit [Nitrospirota bacterium]
MTNSDLSKLRLDKSGENFHRRQKIPRWGLIAIAAAVALSALYFLVASPAVEVDTAVVSRVYPSQSHTLLNASGYVVAQRKAAVASKATGRLEWLGVEEGSRVRTGEVIARLENRDVLAASDQAVAGVNSAKAELADAEQNYKRMKELREKGFVSQSDLDSADTRLKRSQAALTGAEAALRSAQVAVEYTLIRAPFDAVVLTKNADVGDIVTPLGAAANAKAAVVTIADMTSLQVEVDVSESNLAKVKAGQPCEIQLDALPDSRFRGAVHMIVPTADRSKASVMVKVRFVDRDPRILPEMSARVAFLEREMKDNEKAPRTAVNPAALVTRNSSTIVFVVQDEKAVETAVTLGSRIGDGIEVLDGLKPGEKVVLNPPKKLKNGSVVKRKEE